MKFEQIDEPIYTSDLYYDLFDGRNINPRKLLADEDDIAEMLDAMNLIQTFIEEAQENNILEIG